MFELKIKVLVKGARPFKKGRKEDAGYDIWGLEDFVIQAKSVKVVHTGIATAFTEGWVGLILDRGGLGFKGIMRQAGVVDSEYRGEWLVRLLNTSMRAVRIDKDQACAQVVFVP